MPYLIKDDKKVIFIKIPRTGSTSLHESFLDNGWIDKSLKRGFTHGTFNKHVNKFKRENIDMNTVDYIFTILTDPIERIESSFRLICKSPIKKKYTYQEIYPEMDPMKPISINEWWFKYKDKIQTALWSRSQTSYVTNMSNYTNIDKDIYLYKKNNYKYILDKIGKKLNIKLKEFFFHTSTDPRYPLLPKQYLQKEARQEIKELYIDDYYLIKESITP